MTSSTLRVLGALLFASSIMSATACGSTVTSGADDGPADDGVEDDGIDDGSDDGSPCSGEPLGCANGATCVAGEWRCDDLPECPEAEPTEGAACPSGLVCTYEAGMGECGSSERVYTCEEGAWSPARANRCSPPQVECPEAEPEPQSACDPLLEGRTCEYDSGFDCGPGSFAYTCEGGVWSDPMVPRCGLPPCRDNADREECVANGCRWLEPGCGDEATPALPAAGCFELDPCAGSGCLFAEEVCSTVVVVPECAFEENGCDACGAQTSVCLPATLGDR
jgi:hypothetical protein